ncbi:MAG: glycosyltransferase [Candidatus Bathyarchaeia archaeon]
MRIVLFSWEYPPRIIGKLGEYVSVLAAQLVKNKVETYVVTYHDAMTGVVEEANGVKTTRVANPVRTHISVLTWALTLNQEVERAAANIYYQANKRISLLDVFDWHFIPAAVTIKNAYGVPFVYSVESLEDHRAAAVTSPLSMSIKSIEWLGLYEAAKVNVESNWLRDEIIRIHNVPAEKIRVVMPNTGTWIKEVLSTYAAVVGSGRRS